MKAKKKSKKFDLVDTMMRYEDAGLPEAEEIKLFKHLVKTGMAWTLQGSYGRRAQELIDSGLVKRPKPKPTPGKVGPFEMVSRDKIRKFDNGRSFRLVLYGAYNAMGLIGSECNGVAILDEDKLQVLADEIGKIDSGYYGPSKDQVATYDRMMAMSWPEFQVLVNESGRNRYTI